MSYYNNDGDEFDENGQKNPLRDVVKKMEKANADLQKNLEEALATLGKEQKTNRQRTVADVLKDKGADPRLARYVLQDVEDPTAEAVATWLSTEGELFGYKPPVTDAGQLLGLPAGTALPPDLVAAYERFQASQKGGNAPAGADPVTAQLNDPNLTHEQLLALINNAGN